MTAKPPIPGLHSMSVLIAADPAQVAQVRHTLRDALRDWDMGELAEDMEVIVSELVSNAIRHGSGIGVGVGLAAQDGLALLEVADGTDGQPADRRPEDEDEDGRGLLIVRALAKDCGWRTNDRGGTTVWATMPLTSPQGVPYKA
ncbi:ATP-binding protein [Streptomyces sp. NPDC006923]|uniref:ATP-binding protein n=1 Tax=Streptomyces sp. NPDC006923 TaxID=3155355 RepID=UPI0033E295C5